MTTIRTSLVLTLTVAGGAAAQDTGGRPIPSRPDVVQPAPVTTTTEGRPAFTETSRSTGQPNPSSRVAEPFNTTPSRSADAPWGGVGRQFEFTRPSRFYDPELIAFRDGRRNLRESEVLRSIIDRITAETTAQIPGGERDDPKLPIDSTPPPPPPRVPAREPATDHPPGWTDATDQTWRTHSSWCTMASGLFSVSSMGYPRGYAWLLRRGYSPYALRNYWLYHYGMWSGMPGCEGYAYDFSPLYSWFDLYALDPVGSHRDRCAEVTVFTMDESYRVNVRLPSVKASSAEELQRILDEKVKKNESIYLMDEDGEALQLPGGTVNSVRVRHCDPLTARSWW